MSSEDNIYHVNNNGYRKVNSHKKPKDNKKFAKDDSDDDISDKNYPNDENKNIDLEIEKMHIQLEKLRQTKKDLENENENLDYKINNLKKIIKRIQEEED